MLYVAVTFIIIKILKIFWIISFVNYFHTCTGHLSHIEMARKQSDKNPMEIISERNILSAQSMSIKKYVVSIENSNVFFFKTLNVH